MINKIILSIVFLILLMVLDSCDEPFSPYGKFETKYSLNCIVMPDTNLQIATLFQSYPINEKTPRSTSFIHNAFIRLWRGKDEVAILKDSTIINIDSLGNSVPIDVYYTNNFRPQPNDVLEIALLLPDGNRLKSKTRVPRFVAPDVDRSSDIIPSGGGDVVTFAWMPNEDNQIFIPTLKLVYKQNIGGTKITKNIRIPWEYSTINGKEVGIDSPPSRIPRVQYSMANIEKVLHLISKGYTKKSNFYIISAILELKILDENLSTYYLTTSRLFDNYSIILDTQDFSNITGGFGVFGSFIVQKMGIKFSSVYLARFGYSNYFN